MEETEKNIKKKLIEKGTRESKEFFEELQKNKKEKQEKLEKITEEKFKKQQDAEKKEEDIREEIETMLDEDENKIIMIEKYRNLLKAKKESEIALTEYMLAAVKSNPKLAEKYGLTYEDYHRKEPGELLDKSVKGTEKLFGEEKNRKNEEE